jgi:hypothetical protein
MPRLTALLGAALNCLPPWCVRFAPRPVVEALELEQLKAPKLPETGLTNPRNPFMAANGD